MTELEPLDEDELMKGRSVSFEGCKGTHNEVRWFFWLASEICRETRRIEEGTLWFAVWAIFEELCAGGIRGLSSKKNFRWAVLLDMSF